MKKFKIFIKDKPNPVVVEADDINQVGMRLIITRGEKEIGAFLVGQLDGWFEEI